MVWSSGLLKPDALWKTSRDESSSTHEATSSVRSLLGSVEEKHNDKLLVWREKRAVHAGRMEEQRRMLAFADALNAGRFVQQKLWMERMVLVSFWVESKLDKAKDARQRRAHPRHRHWTAQREATRRAAKLAGGVKHTITEPTTAALAFGRGKEDDKTVLVFDLGGGTSGVSVVEVQSKAIRVLATDGDTHLGGRL